MVGQRFAGVNPTENTDILGRACNDQFHTTWTALYAGINKPSVSDVERNRAIRVVVISPIGAAAKIVR